MAPLIDQQSQDAKLEDMADNTAKVVLVSAASLVYAEMNATYALADVAVTPGAGNGDFTLGDISGGRRMTCAAQSAVAVDATGTGTHVAWLDTANSRVKAVHQLSGSGIAVTSGGTVNIPATYADDMDPTTS